MDTMTKRRRIFAYLIKDQEGQEIMICPACAKKQTEKKPCYYTDYSCGYEVWGCVNCNETLNTPF
jgi:hypothetical protein